MTDLTKNISKEHAAKFHSRCGAEWASVIDYSYKLKELLRTITYKPSSTISILHVCSTGVDFGVTLIKTDPTTEQIVSLRGATIEILVDVNTVFEPEVILEALYKNIQELELHEVNEWLKVDSKHYVEPHTEG
jgi:hypothetical protein